MQSPVWLEVWNAIIETLRILVWPIVTLVAFFCVKEEVLGLFPSLQKLSIKGVELGFAQRVEQAEVQAEMAEASAVSQLEQIPDQVKRHLNDLGQGVSEEALYYAKNDLGKHPREIIVDAWYGIRSNVFRLVEELRLRKLELGTKEGIISPEALALASSLQKVATVEDALKLLATHMPSDFNQQTISTIMTLKSIRDDVLRYSFSVSRETAESYISSALHLNKLFYSVFKHIQWMGYSSPAAPVE